MKKSLAATAIFLFILTSLVFCPFAAAGAEVNPEYKYLKIEGDGVNLLSSKSADDSGAVIFELPKSWYVELTDDSDAAYYAVIYHGVAGYIARGGANAQKLSKPGKFISKNNEKPYFETKIKLPVTGFLLSSTTADSTNVQIAAGEYDYYGAKSDGSTLYFYTVVNGNAGYVNAFYTESRSGVSVAQSASDFTLPPSDPSTPELNNGKDSPDAQNNLVRILLIVAICLLSLLCVFLLFKPVKGRRGYELKKKRRDDIYEDDDDYYRG